MLVSPLSRCSQLLVAGLIDRVLSNIDNETVIAQVRNEIVAWCKQFPVPAVGDFVGIEV